MTDWLRRIESSPALVRAVPFLLFALITLCQGKLGPTSQYWCYLAKTVLVGMLLWVWRRQIREMRWRFSLEAVAAGILVFVIWVGLEGHYPLLMKGEPNWTPFGDYGEGSVMGWFFVLTRIGGSSLVVPFLEEVFYRSFLYRWIAKPDFTGMALGTFGWKPFIVTSVVFGVAHNEWLAGILCGFIYQGLVCWRKRLDDAVAAHAITNLLLGIWVVWKGAWQFW